MERRDLLADTAIGVLARAGMRGLTHRAVDAAAGLSEGTSSYYFRTRAALLQACVDRLTARTVERIAARPRDGAPPDLAAALVAGATALLERWLGDDRDLLLARYELSLESTRRPELESALVAGGARVREAVAATMRAAGLPDAERRANDLAACIDGLAFDQVAGAGRHLRDAAGRRRAVSAVVDALVRVDDPPS